MGVQNMYRLLNPAPAPPAEKGLRNRTPAALYILNRKAFPPSSQPPGPAPLTRGTYRVIILTYEGVSLPVALLKKDKTRCCTMNFEDLIAKVKTCGKQKLAVAAAEDDAVLEAVDAARKQGIADAILVGDEAAIRKIAAELDID